jgi:hypothetical protein
MRQTYNPLLEFLTARTQPDGEASRANRRRPTASTIELSWIEKGCWKSSTARFLDISRGGAALSSPVLPTIGGIGRLRCLEEDGSPWVEVKILGVDRHTKGRHRVRVRFEGGCPGFLLRLAILGGPEARADDEPFPQYSWLGTESD